MTFTTKNTKPSSCQPRSALFRLVKLRRARLLRALELFVDKVVLYWNRTTVKAYNSLPRWPVYLRPYYCGRKLKITTGFQCIMVSLLFSHIYAAKGKKTNLFIFIFIFRTSSSPIITTNCGEIPIFLVTSLSNKNRFLIGLYF